MYELDNGKCYDSLYWTEWASTVHIKSSTEAAAVWQNLENDGVLSLEKPNGDKKRLANHEWARLCIAYCFAKIPFKQWEKPTNQNGTEISAFNTMFNQASKTGEEKFWLAYISQRLFQDLPKKQHSKRAFLAYIQYAWHNGAIGLWERYEKALNAYDGNVAEAKKILFAELAELANQPRNYYASNNISGSLKTPLTNAPSNDLSEKIVEILQNMGKGVKEIQLSAQGVRYDEYLVQFAGYPEWDKWHEHFCSALGVKSDKGNVRAEQHSGIPHALDIKILRNKDTWQTLGRNEFQAALTQYSTLKRPFKLPVLLGVDEYGNAVFNDFADAPHAIIGGATGTGKSALLRAMLHSLFKFADEQSTEIAIVYCKDSRDFSEFQNYPNLWQGKIISEPNEALEALAYFVEEMDRRYQSDEPLSSHKTMILVIDELADLVIVNKQVETQLIRLAMKARASRIHLLLATQRPDAKTLDGQLRDNLPVKIALRVDSRSASEIILKEGGAENLGEKGDHLVRWNGGAAQFLHGYNV